jgi:hypothetical protein
MAEGFITVSSCTLAREGGVSEFAKAACNNYWSSKISFLDLEF